MSIYNNLFNIIQTYLYGGSITPGSFEELVCILISTIACIWIIALPFTIVLKIIKSIVG